MDYIYLLFKILIFLKQLSIISIIIMEITKFIFEILGALGAIGTFGAFVMLFIKDKYKQDQIDKLTNITEKLTNIASTLEVQNDNLAKQLRASVLPELWTNGIYQDANGIDFKINLSNRGEIAKLIKFELESDDIILHNEHLPSDLLKEEERWIFCESNCEKRHVDCKYIIYVIYTDKLGNKYKLKIKSAKNAYPVIVGNDLV